MAENKKFYINEKEVSEKEFINLDLEQFKKTNEDDPHVFRPHHYMGYEIEPWTYSFINDLPGFEHSILTYLLRWRKKNGIEDLRKIIRIIEMKIELELNKDKYIPERGCL